MTYLEQDAVDAVPHGRLVPLDLSGMLLELVEHDGLEDVIGHGVAGQIEVPVSQSLQNGQDLSPTAAVKESIFHLGEGDDPGVTLHGGLLTLKRRR